MASILDDQDESLLGPSASTGGASSTSPTTTTSSGSTTPGTAPPSGGGTPINTQPSQGDISNIANLNSSIDFSPLVNSLQGEGTTARGDLSDAQNTFNTALGAKPVFGQDQQNILGDVLKGNQPLATGAGLLNTQYTGPTGIDTSKFNTDQAKYANDSGMTQDSDSLSNLLGLRDASLTPGDARFDAIAFRGNPDFQTASNNLVSDASNLGKAGVDATTGANSAITQRKSDIGDFNNAGTGYVGQQRDNINNLIGGQMTAANGADTNLSALLASLKGANGNIANIPDAQLAFTRSLYGAPQEITSQYGKDIFDRTINPNDYLSYIAGQGATRNNVATQDEATQFNNAEKLLFENDALNPTSRQAGQLNFDQNAQAAALAQAQRDMAAADAAELARRNAAAVQPASVQTAAQTVATDPNGPGNTSSDSGSGGVGSDGSDGTDGSGGTGPGGGENGGGHDAGDGDGGGGDSGGDGGFEKGGMIKGKGGPRQDNILEPVSSGEYVINNPASKAIGKPLLDALNRIGNKNESASSMAADEANTIGSAAHGKFMGGQIGTRAIGVPARGMAPRGAPSTKIGFADGGQIAAPTDDIARMTPFQGAPSVPGMVPTMPPPIKTPALSTASPAALQALIAALQQAHR